MSIVIHQAGTLQAMLDTAQAVFPGIALLDEGTRERFVRLLDLVQQWHGSARDSRKGIIMQAAIMLGSSRAAAQRLFQRVVSTQDYGLLLPKPRKDAGVARAWDDAAMDYLKARYLALRSKKLAYNETLEACGVVNLRVGSYRNACHHMSRWERESGTQAMQALAYKSKDYDDEFDTPILRDTSDLVPMEIICGDHHQFDVVVLWPDGQIVRPWVSAWIDVRTRRWLGLTVCRTPDSKSIADSLYITIKRLGIAQNYYIDNGKAYRARVLKGTGWQEDEIGRIDLPADAQAMLDALHNGLYGNSRRVHAIPFNARAKVVERYFGIGGFSDWCKTLPGWTGRRYEQMPDETRRRIKSRQLLTLDEFLVRFIHQVAEMNSRASRAHGMGQGSPNDVLAWYIQRGWKPTFPADMRMLDFMAMHTDKRKVRSYGIQFGSAKDDPVFYYAEELRRHVGKFLTVKWSGSEVVVREVFAMNDDGKRLRAIPAHLLAFDERGQFIAQCEPVQRTRYLDEPGLAERLKQRAQIKKKLKADIADLNGAVEYVQLPPVPAVGEEAIREVPQIVVKKVDNLSDFEREIRENRKKRSFRDVLHRPTGTTDSDEEVIL